MRIEACASRAARRGNGTGVWALGVQSIYIAVCAGCACVSVSFSRFRGYEYTSNRLQITPHGRIGNRHPTWLRPTPRQSDATSPPPRSINRHTCSKRAYKAPSCSLTPLSNAIAQAQRAFHSTSASATCSSVMSLKMRATPRPVGNGIFWPDENLTRSYRASSTMAASNWSW